MTRFAALVLVLALFPVRALPAVEEALGESSIRFSADPRWIRHEAKLGAAVEAECDLRWSFPPAPPSMRGEITPTLTVRAVLFATYRELTLEEARDGVLDNVKANQRLGNGIKVIESRQLGPAAWWIITDESRVMFGPPGAAPDLIHFHHRFIYFVLGKKMIIQASEFFPASQPHRHQEMLAELTRVVSSFTDNGAPMFVFAKGKPAKAK